MTANARHLEVEQQNIGLGVSNQLTKSGPVACLPNDGEIGLLGEDYFYAGSKQCVIVSDDNLDFVRLVSSGHGGPSRLTDLIGRVKAISSLDGFYFAVRRVFLVLGGWSCFGHC